MRTGEVVEVEVEEEDEESLYMQTALTSTMRPTWSSLLQRLVTLADAGEEHRGLLAGLKRRIQQSLYMNTPRGVQLHAALVAVTSDAGGHGAEICDTEDNDAGKLEAWWSELKGHMALGQSESGRMDLGGAPTLDAVVAADTGPGHSRDEVERWETERQTLAQELQEEREEEQRLYDQRAQEEALQDEADSALFLEQEAARFRDWEQWEVLHTPTVRKRKRLLVDVHPGRARAINQGEMVERAVVEMPSGSQDFHVVLQIEQYEVPVDVPNQAVDHGGVGMAAAGVDVNSATYDRAYQAWKRGDLRDSVITEVFGPDWLFLFQVNRDGLPGDTVPMPPTAPSPPAVEDKPGATQMDTSEVDRSGGVWLQGLQGAGGVVDLEGLTDVSGSTVEPGGELESAPEGLVEQMEGKSQVGSRGREA